MIEARISPQLLQAVAVRTAQGRRLYVGTTNLDTGKLVIWDMGAIASSRQCNAIDLYRKIILASASVPGFLPPVQYRGDGQRPQFTELHADGGATAKCSFVLPCSASMPHSSPAVDGHLSAPHVHHRCGKGVPGPQMRGTTSDRIASTALSSLTYAQTRNDLIRIYTLTLLTGMDYRVAMIPQDFPISNDSMSFEPAEMQRLYQQGFQLAAGNRVWADIPPVLDASQESIPRSGAEFFVPYEAGIRTGSSTESAQVQHWPTRIAAGTAHSCSKSTQSCRCSRTRRSNRIWGPASRRGQGLGTTACHAPPLTVFQRWENSRRLWERLPMLRDERARPLECGDSSPLSFSPLSLACDASFQGFPPQQERKAMPSHRTPKVTRHRRLRQVRFRTKRNPRKP